VSYFIIAVMTFVAGFGPAQFKRAPVSGYEVVRTYPHDPKAFTQGLFYLDGFLYEGTGMNGESSIRKVRLENGEVVQIHWLGSGTSARGSRPSATRSCS
jgi:glutamine cyclotransferase